jgi:phosphate transport system permease protein
MDYKARKALTRKRYRADQRFRLYCVASSVLALAFLVVLLLGITVKGISAFTIREIKIDFIKTSAALPQKDTPWDYDHFLMESLVHTFPNVNESDLHTLKQFVDLGTRRIIFEALSTGEPSQKEGSLWVPASDFYNVTWSTFHTLPESVKNKSYRKIELLQSLEQQDRTRSSFNWRFFTNTDSRNPSTAGIKGALIGSLYLILMTFLFAVPIGVGAALYLEEYAPKNKLTSFIVINITNLAAVPSIVYGILGLAVFINFLGLPRSSAFVGGLTLALMTLPVIIVSAESAIRNVPRAIKDAALGLGASPIQVTFHHVIPLALPGIITGSIIALARALGETAPLLMIGMMAFVASPATTPFEPSSALPVQIYTWAKNPEPRFIANAAAAIMILMIILIVINVIAIILRKKFEKKL